MKIRRASTAFTFLILSSIGITSALLLPREAGNSPDNKQLARDEEIPLKPSVEIPSTGSKPVVDGVGTKDAPVDGKDGRPHLGPFVETSAERDRKKAKENGGDDVPKKPVKEMPKGASKEKMPETNDGVMDDPHRTGPKEGTRGTEGGISEKSKDRKEAQADGSKSEKKPDPPKEAPPLPHSEQETLKQQTPKDDSKKSKDVAADDEMKKDDKKKEKELGGLEVCAKGYLH